MSSAKTTLSVSQKKFLDKLVAKYSPYSTPEHQGNWRYSETNDSWLLHSETDDSRVPVYVLISFFANDEVRYALFSSKDTSELHTWEGLRGVNYSDCSEKSLSQIMKDIDEDFAEISNRHEEWRRDSDTDY